MEGEDKMNKKSVSDLKEMKENPSIYLESHAAYCVYEW